MQQCVLCIGEKLEAGNLKSGSSREKACIVNKTHTNNILCCPIKRSSKQRQQNSWCTTSVQKLCFNHLKRNWRPMASWLPYQQKTKAARQQRTCQQEIQLSSLSVPSAAFLPIWSSLFSSLLCRFHQVSGLQHPSDIVANRILNSSRFHPKWRFSTCVCNDDEKSIRYGHSEVPQAKAAMIHWPSLMCPFKQLILKAPNLKQLAGLWFHDVPRIFMFYDLGGNKGSVLC